MSQLYRFYRDILSGLPFSIRGYQHAEPTIADFFTKLSNDSLIQGNPDVQFLSYSYVVLKDVNTWSTRNFDQFYYHAQNDRYSDLLISLYMYIRARIQEHGGDPNPSTSAHHLASLLARECGFRVRCTDSSEWYFGYQHDKHVLCFELPFSTMFKVKEDQLRSSLGEYLREVSALSLSNPDAALFVKAVHNRRLYRYRGKLTTTEYHNELLGAAHSSFFEQVLDLSKIDLLTKELVSALRYFDYANPGFFLKGTPEKAMAAWLSQLVAIAFFGYCHQAWVEYMPSTCGVFGEKREIQRNLGSLIVGYSMGKELSTDERIYLKLACDRVSAILAANMLRTARQEPSGQRWYGTEAQFGRGYPEESFKTQYHQLRENLSEYDERITNVAEEAQKVWDRLYATFPANGKIPKAYFADATIKLYGAKTLDEFLIFRRIYLGLWYARQDERNKHLRCSYANAGGAEKDKPNWDLACVLYGLTPAEFDEVFKKKETKAAYKQRATELRSAAGIGTKDLINGVGILPEEEEWLLDLGYRVE